MNNTYEGNRKDNVHNEVALDYSAGFQSAIADIASLESNAMPMSCTAIRTAF